jgi:TPR repeat protein
VGKDEEEALKWYTKAAEQGYETSKDETSKGMLERGRERLERLRLERLKSK